ncbi:MAG: hypothetical protein Ct9H300mP11_07610 [Chloroflexota bacterium]|nr:MAG: hypothetical protein Ct9H300mP11_07610 [Chloroflexota bacterium]
MDYFSLLIVKGNQSEHPKANNKSKLRKPRRIKGIKI